MFLSLKFLCCTGMSNRYVSELVYALQATLSEALRLQSSIRETTFFRFPEMHISYFLETAFSVVILGGNNSSFLPFRFTQLTVLFFFEWITVRLLSRSHDIILTLGIFSFLAAGYPDVLSSFLFVAMRET